MIQNTIDEIKAKKDGLLNWETFKTQKIQQVYIEMINKSKTELYTLNKYQVTEKLIQYVKMIPRFFDFCGEYKKELLLNEIRSYAENLAQEYIQRKNEELMIKRKNIENNYKFRKDLESEDDKYSDDSYKKRKSDSESEDDKYSDNSYKKRKSNSESEDDKYSNNSDSEDDNYSESDSKEEERDEDIEKLARRVIRGDFGNGEERRKRLGKKYAPVQNRVNEILGFSKRY